MAQSWPWGSQIAVKKKKKKKYLAMLLQKIQHTFNPRSTRIVEVTDEL